MSQVGNTSLKIKKKYLRDRLVDKSLIFTDPWSQGGDQPQYGVSTMRSVYLLVFNNLNHYQSTKITTKIRVLKTSFPV